MLSLTPTTQLTCAFNFVVVHALRQQNRGAAEQVRSFASPSVATPLNQLWEMTKFDYTHCTTLSILKIVLNTTFYHARCSPPPKIGNAEQLTHNSRCDRLWACTAAFSCQLKANSSCREIARRDEQHSHNYSTPSVDALRQTPTREQTRSCHQKHHAMSYSACGRHVNMLLTWTPAVHSGFDQLGGEPDM
jgi:hypothetical protein